MPRKRKKINRSRLETDRAVREAKQAERELYRELAKMTEGPLLDDWIDPDEKSAGDVDSDDEDE